MSAARRAILSGLLVACGCGAAQPDLRPEATRSESASIVLPTDPVSLAAMLGVVADSLRAAGEERYSRQEYDSARAIWRVELARATSAHDAAAEARVRMWIGLAAYRLGDYAISRREGETSVALKRKLGLDAELSRSFNALGLLAWNEGRHRDALVAFDSAVASARRHDDAAGIARVAGNIPLVKVELGDFDGARRGFEEAIRAGREIDDDRVQGNALANLAMLEIRLGNARQALPLLADARRHYAVIEYSTGESNALGQLATAFSSLGDLQSAISAADSALRISRAQGLQQETAATLEVLADLHAQAGSLRLALRSLREADSLDRQLGLAVERGTNLRRTSIILFTLGELPPAISAARQALIAHAAVEARGEMAYDRMQLAEALAQTGDLRRAEAETDTALSDAQRMKNPSAMRDAAAVAARLALNAGDAKKAIQRLGNDTRSEATNDWRLLDLRSEALLALGRMAEAEAVAKRAIAALERERASLAIGPLRSVYLASRTGPFARLVAIELARHDTVSAFEVAASVPGRALTERLGGLSGAGGSVASLAEGERLLQRAAAIEGQISALDSVRGRAEQRAELERALESARAAYEDHLASGPGASAGGVMPPSPVSLRDVQSRLAPDEALLVFLSGPDRLDCFLVRKNRLRYWNAPLGERGLAQRVRMVRGAIASAHRLTAVPVALGELHDILLGPAIAAGAFAGVSRTYVIPHGSLGALPFAALWNRRTGRFLIEEQELAYLPSAAALARGNPTNARDLLRVAVFAPLPDSLPGTAVEARMVSRVAGNATLRIGKDARERDARAAIAAGLPIHIASHGSHNSQNPLFSRMSVGRARPGGSNDDGWLEVHEILGMTTTSPLVFLSGCETGLGSAADGPFAQVTEEGSLSQAFLLAGARNVVATLWRVNDAGAVAMAKSFYRNLRTTGIPESALAIAQREAIRRGTDFTWAAYSMSRASGGGRRNSA